VKPLGAIPPETLVGDPIGWYTFARLEFPAPTGILRFTDYPGDEYIGDVDGAEETWDARRGCRVPELAYLKASPLSNATLELGNSDAYFSDLANLHGTLRGRPALVWRCHFEVRATDDPLLRLLGPIGDLYDVLLCFDGETDRQDVQDTLSLALAPADEWRTIPGRRVDPRNFPFLSKPNVTFKWGSVTVTVPAAPRQAPTGYGAPIMPPYAPKESVVLPDPR